VRSQSEARGNVMRDLEQSQTPVEEKIEPEKRQFQFTPVKRKKMPKFVNRNWNTEITPRSEVRNVRYSRSW
jgi:hypothetical protein